jgi:hypothetical protein
MTSHLLLLTSLVGAATRPDKSAAIAAWVLFVVALEECALVEPDGATKKVALSRAIYLVALSALADLVWCARARRQRGRRGQAADQGGGDARRGGGEEGLADEAGGEAAAGACVCKRLRWAGVGQGQCGMLVGAACWPGAVLAGAGAAC